MDLREVVLGYLMDGGARAIAGMPVDLSSQVAVFQRGVDALHEEGSSVLKTALAAEEPWAGPMPPRGAMSMFYTGDNVCSGRYLAMAEAFLLIVQMVKTLDGEPAKGRQVIRGIVNHLDGDPKVEMRLAPPVPGARPGAAISPPSPASASA